MLSFSANEVLEAARAYGDGGWRVFPCAHDKRPLVKWGNDATTDPLTIDAWWRRWPDALIGLPTGNGLVVIDDDRGGAEPEPDLAITRTARTRSRGWHHYFRHDGSPIGNRVGLLPGVDVRGEGGYVVAPPSPGWEWWNGEAPMCLLPEWVVTIMRAEQERKRFGPGFTPRRPGDFVGEGGRNDYLARFTGWAISAREAAVGFVDPSALLVEVFDHNTRVCLPPLELGEVRTIVRSILSRHQR